MKVQQEEEQKEQGQELRQQQMASLGRLLADFSHEMRNHLAVIQEANGLLQDILAMQENEAPPLVASLEDTAAQIGKRVRTCADLCRQLSSMAHRSDIPYSSFSVNELLAELAVFLERSARSQQVLLQLELGGIGSLYSEPALLQYVLYQLYVFSLARMSKGQMTIRSAQTGETVLISFCLAGVAQADLAELPETVLVAVSLLGSQLEALERTEARGTECFGFRLLVPVDVYGVC